MFSYKKEIRTYRMKVVLPPSRVNHGKVGHFIEDHSKDGIRIKEKNVR